MDSKIIFQDNGSMVSIEALYCIGGYVTYEVSISANGFLGTNNFCIEEDKLKQYIQKIDYMIKTLSGELKICDFESDAFLRFFFEDIKSFYVLGQIGGSYEDNMLKFRFKADQTLLYGLKRVLLDY